MIGRWLVPLLVVAMIATAWVMTTSPAERDLGLAPDPSARTYRGCAGWVGRGLEGSIAVAAAVRGPVRVTTVAGGADRVSVMADIDEAGGALVPLANLEAAGAIGAVAEFPTANAEAALITAGAPGTTVVGCTVPGTTTLIAGGGSTLAEETLDLVIANPYAVDSVVSVQSASEVGTDSASELASVIVPARSTVLRELAPLLPLRQSLSVRLEVQAGAVHGSLIQRVAGDIASTEAVSPATEWFFPVVEGEGVGRRRIVISSNSSIATEVAIDAYGPEGLIERVLEIQVPPMSQIEMGVADLGDGVVGARITATNPVVASLVLVGEQRRGLAPMTAGLSTDWWVPGSGSLAVTTMWILNPTDLEAEVVVQPLAPNSPARPVVIPPESRQAVQVVGPGAGHLIKSSVEVSVMWTAQGEAGIALGTGIATAPHL